MAFAVAALVRTLPECVMVRAMDTQDTGHPVTVAFLAVKIPGFLPYISLRNAKNCKNRIIRVCGLFATKGWEVDPRCRFKHQENRAV